MVVSCGRRVGELFVKDDAFECMMMEEEMKVFLGNYEFLGRIC